MARKKSCWLRFPAALAAFTSLLLLFPSAVSAASYPSYNYNVYGESVPVPLTYEVDRVLDGETLGTNKLVSPTDMAADKDGIYILDAGNNRILVLSTDFRLQKSITPADKSVTLVSAVGISRASDGTFLLASESQQVVYRLDIEGNLVYTYGKPTGTIVPDDLSYSPTLAIEGLDGAISIVSKGSYEGLIQLNKRGEYLGYFGSNKVEVTASVLASYFWKKIFSETQKDTTQKMIPIEYTSIDMDADGFLYAVVLESTSSTGELKKIDPKGNNILRGRDSGDVPPGVILQTGNYGDLETTTDQGVKVDTEFTDVCVDDDGFIHALDATRGRVFQYDQESNLLSIFGGLSDQEGTFGQPVAVECVGDYVLVLDKERGQVQVFQPTEFGATLRSALKLDSKGLYSEAKAAWESVLLRTTNCDMAYVGIGKAYYGAGDYRTAMKYFKLGYAKTEYNEAYNELRKDYLKSHFLIAVLVLTAACLAIWLARKGLKKWGGVRRLLHRDRSYLDVGYAVFHPFKAFDDVRIENKGSFWTCGVSLSLLLVAYILKCGLTGFLFNNQRMENIHIWRDCAMIAALVIIFIFSNGAVTTLIEGEGRWRDIVIVTGYSLIPLTATWLISMAVSNGLTLREEAFLSLFSAFGILWAFIVLFVGLMTVHRYSAGKTLVSLLLTVFGMLLIVFLLVMIYTLFNQFVVFVGNLLTEMIYRL